MNTNNSWHANKLRKALYGLKQASHTWLLTYFISKGFKRGQVDPTLFIKSCKNDIFIAQVYIDNMIFESINKELLNEFYNPSGKRI